MGPEVVGSTSGVAVVGPSSLPGVGGELPPVV
jgi:hypothetical protein